MIFLSHSWNDKPSARKVVEALAMERIPCWLDEQQLSGGAELRASLRSAITKCDVYLYFVSSAANASEWCRDELQFALGLEHDSKLQIVPVRLANNDDALPELLSGRVYSSLEPTAGGAARLAHDLTSIEGHDSFPSGCSLSATVRLAEHQLVHTLKQAREKVAGRPEFGFSLLDDEYESLADRYWNVAEVTFPPVSGDPRQLTDVANVISSIHNQSRMIIKEARTICLRFVDTDLGDDSRYYYDAGHDRALRVLLHRLDWNARYLKSLRDDITIDQQFVNAKDLAAPFDGHYCDFLSDGQFVGGVQVPKYGHPFSANVTNLPPWGLTDPFADIPEIEVGTAIGEIVALRFMAQTRSSTEMPSPESLTYGLK